MDHEGLSYEQAVERYEEAAYSTFFDGPPERLVPMPPDRRNSYRVEDGWHLWGGQGQGHLATVFDDKRVWMISETVMELRDEEERFDSFALKGALREIIGDEAYERLVGAVLTLWLEEEEGAEFRLTFLPVDLPDSHIRAILHEGFALLARPKAPTGLLAGNGEPEQLQYTPAQHPAYRAYRWLRELGPSDRTDKCDFLREVGCPDPKTAWSALLDLGIDQNMSEVVLSDGFVLGWKAREIWAEDEKRSAEAAE